MGNPCIVTIVFMYLKSSVVRCRSITELVAYLQRLSKYFLLRARMMSVK